MYKQKIAIVLVILTIVGVYIKSIVDLQSDKMKMQEDLLCNEHLLSTAKDEVATTQELLNNQIQQNESLAAELDTLRLQFEALKEECEEYKTLISFVDLDAPSNQKMKTYMDYRAITAKSSPQYRLQHTLAYTGEYGLRMVNGRYCIALGSYYTTTIGQYVDIKLENGKIIRGILADQKADAHTDDKNQMHPDGSVVEFVIDAEAFDPDLIQHSGDISYLNGWNSKVVNIRVYDKVEDF